MATVYVYNDATGGVERYEKGLDEAMPYVIGRTMTVREFRGSSCSNVLWTDRRAIRAWNITRQTYNAPIPMMFAFKRIWEGGHSGQSQHYAGVAYDVGQTLSAAERRRLHTIAEETGAWSYVEPLVLTPGWVHLDRRSGPPACPSGGYPALRLGNRGVYVFVMQDALNALGYTGGGLDGVFGAGTENALRRFQTAAGLTSDGIAGCNTWRELSRRAVGIGQTAGVVGKC